MITKRRPLPRKESSGPSVGAPSTVVRLPTPRVTFVALRNSTRSDKEVEVVAIPSAATQAVEYKDCDDFVNDVAKVGKGVYVFRFDNCKKMVAEAYPTLDLSCILGSGEEEGAMEGGEEVAEEQVAKKNGADEEVVEVQRPRQLQLRLVRRRLPLQKHRHRKTYLLMYFCFLPRALVQFCKDSFIHEKLVSFQ